MNNNLARTLEEETERIKKNYNRIIFFYSYDLTATKENSKYCESCYGNLIRIINNLIFIHKTMQLKHAVTLVCSMFWEML